MTRILKPISAETLGCLDQIFAQYFREERGMRIVERSLGNDFERAFPELRDEQGAAHATAIAVFAGGAGEPWLCTPTPDVLSSWLDEAGWDVVQQVDEADATGPHFWPRTDALRPVRLTRLVHAVRR